MIRRHLAAALCPAGEFCADTKPSRGLSHGLLWRCPDCGRIWRCTVHQDPVHLGRALWVWKPAGLWVRVTLWRRVFAEEVGAR